MNIRLANKQDLSALEQMFNRIVAEMHKNGVNIWNEYYPFEEFENDIEKSRLYLLVDENNICAAFVLFDDIAGAECFKWENNNAKPIYIGRLGVNVDYLRQGVGSRVIQEAIKLSKQMQGEYLRLTVVKENIPAIKLYLKNGFKQVEGVYNECIDDLGTTLQEFGFELKI